MPFWMQSEDPEYYDDEYTEDDYDEDNVEDIATDDSRSYGPYYGA